MQTDACDLDYIYEPLTPYRRGIMDFIALWMPDDVRVMDIGCGAVGFYWALGYLHKASSVSFGDRHGGILDTLAARMDAMTPESLARDFGPWGWQGGADYAAWLGELHGKIADVTVMDALGTPEGRFDALVAVELFECAQDEGELAAMVSFCAGSLAPGGRLIGCCLNYDEWTPALAALAAQRQAGPLNPSAGTLRDMLERAGLRLLSLESRETGMGNFPVCQLFCAEKPV